MQVSYWIFMFVAVAALFSYGASTTSFKKKLYIGAFFGINVSNGAWSSLALKPVVEMALHHVNNDTTLLMDYELWYQWEDSKCESGAAIRALLKLQDAPPYKIVFLGPGCSLAAKPVAEAMPYWSSVQVGYSISSPLFSDKDKFPRLFRTATSETMENPARVAILKYFKWNKIALFVQNLDIFVMTKERLITQLEKENITLLASESFNNDPSSSLKYIQDRDARVIIALMYEDKFRATMCSAYKRGYYGDKYVWIIVGWYNDDWWARKDVTCSSEQLRNAASNMIETVPLPLSQSPLPTVSKKTARQLKEEYDELMRVQNMTTNLYGSFTYDAVWTISRMLNASVSLLAEYNKSLENLTYGDELTATIFTKLLQQTDFPGMSGRVTFDENGDRQTVVQITQNKDGVKTVVGTYDARDARLNITQPGFQWKDGRVPASGVTRIKKLYEESLTDTIVLLCLASSGLLFCLFCLLLYYSHRENRYIKMSSPHFNNITAIGCFVCYVDVLLSTYSGSRMGTGHAALCVTRSWLLPTGFTLAFGGIFAKTYRVYKIFTNTELKKELGGMSNTSLAFRLFVYWLGNVCVLLAWHIVDPVTSKLERVKEQRDPDNDDLIVEVFSNQCHSNYYNHWIVALLGYQGVLLLFGMFLAWETRNVHIAALNDSKSIGIAVYNVFMFSCLAIFIEFFLPSGPTRMFFLRLIIYGCSTSTICLIFVPKIYHLKKSSRVEHATESIQTSEAAGNTGVRSATKSNMNIESVQSPT